MPRYHFEFVRQDGAVLFDAQGKDLPDLDAALAHARITMRAVLKDATSAIDWSEWTTLIKSADGEELAAILFSDVMNRGHSP